MKLARTIFFSTFVLVTALAGAQNQPAPLQLTLQETITRALKSNLSVLLASAQVENAAGTRQRQLASLLPHVTADHVTSFHNQNLQALGLSFTGFPIPKVVGPLSNYDYRVYANQSVIDRQAYHALKSSERQQDAAQLSYQDSLNLVIRQAAGLYLTSQTAQAEVEADESRVTTSTALLKLAQDQHDLGLATGIDVVRAQVQLQRDQQTLLVARDDYETSILNLQRFIGMMPGEPVALAQRLEFHPLQPPKIGAAVETALQARSDYRSLFSQREALLEQQKAAHARYLPKLSVDGNYGALGRSYGSMPGIGLIEGVVSITVFDRDREGQQAQIASQLHQIDAQIADMRRGIEQDLRKALLDLQSTEQQVSVTQAGLDLAQRELTLAQDRFKNGLNDNIEVITAQSSLQSAQDDRIAALARHADAAIALGRALGATGSEYQKYMDSNVVSPQTGEEEK
jgi:outer membrane protein TolC